jgi:hypothetical protein
MNEMQHDRTLADCRGNAFHIPGARIADNKYTGEARFEHVWGTGERPRNGRCGCLKIMAGKDKALTIKRQTF